MSYSFTDHAGDEQDGIERAESRAEESLREQRWAEFVSLIESYRESATSGLREWSDVIEAVGHARFIMAECDCDGPWKPNPFERACGAFAESEGGWDAVLNAIARAIRESKADAAQVLERR